MNRLLALPLLALAGCATAPKAPPGPPVDLTAARAAVEAARKSGPVEKTGPLAKAEQHLQEAEKLAAEADRSPEKSARAQGLADLASTEAQWALSLSTATDSSKSAGARGGAAEVERLTARLKRAEEEKRQKDERIALLVHDLELTETEVIRTKARLKGLETKAEAASAIAEARILMRRLDRRTSAAALARCEDALAKAEQQLQQENYGAALFFATKAQDAANKAREAPGVRRPPAAVPR